MNSNNFNGNTRSSQVRNIPYNTMLKRLTGSTNASILLRQLIFWWDATGRKPFYKYLSPIKQVNGRPLPPTYNGDYDTLEVELEFTRTELRTALDIVNQRVYQGGEKRMDVFSWRYVLQGNITMFEINEAYIRQCLIAELPIQETCIGNSEFKLGKVLKLIANSGNLHPIETETNAETKTEKKHISEKSSSSSETASSELETAIAYVCGMDLELAPTSTQKAITSIAGKLIKKDVQPSRIKAFGDWWQYNDWRGKKGQSPTPQQIGETWKQFEDAPHTPITAYEPPTQDVDLGKGFYV